MARTEQSCYVYVQLPGTFEWVPCASLRVREVGSGSFAGTFVYGRRYLERPNVVTLDEYHLPLTDRPMQFTKLKGIPGALRDASPDAWGRRVIQAKLQLAAADISELEYLLNGPDDGAGNLRFGRLRRPLGHHARSTAPVSCRRSPRRPRRWRKTALLPHEVLEELEPGTSMGGARPKVTIEDDHKIWLAKLPEKRDLHNMQRIEYATLELARKAGLNVCGTRTEKVGAAEALMLQRFDRAWNPDAKAYARYGLVSGLTVLDAEEGYTGRERWSYLLLADEMRRWSIKPDEDRRELFRRMVFNAMVTNNDDHPRNHALLRTTSGWRLSPAYDIVPVALVSQERRDLALNVGRFGRAASMYNLLSETGAFGLSREEAEAEINRMLGVVRSWSVFFAAHGVEHRSIEMLQQAILPESFFRTEPPDALT